MKMNRKASFSLRTDDGLEVGAGPEQVVTSGARDFEPRLVRYLVAMLDRYGFSHVAFALMRSGADLSERGGDREEFDALMRLAMDLLARQMPGHEAGTHRPAEDADLRPKALRRRNRLTH